MECQVCYLPYNTSTRKPKSLPCGHTFCAECLTKLLDESTSIIVCPKDRTECQVPNKKAGGLATNFALLDLLGDDCNDCHEKSQDKPCCDDCNKKSQDGPCLPEHCSKRLCSDCKTSHLKKFSVELVVELQAIKKQVTEQQAKCDDESDNTKMVDQSKAAIAEVSQIFDAEKQRMIDAIREKQEMSSSNYFQWKNNFNHCLAQCQIFVDKVLSDIQQEVDSQSGKFLSGVKKQVTQEMKAILEVEQTKNRLPLFDASEVQQVFDRMRPALFGSVMPLMSIIPDYTAAEFSRSYGKRGSGAGEFNGPWGIASSPVTGNVAISDRDNHRIHILTPDLCPVRVFGTKGSGQNQFTYPRGVCFSSTGSLFIADKSNHRIQQVSEEGEHIRTFGSQGTGEGQFQYPGGICWERGLLYVCDAFNSRLQVMKDSGEHGSSIGSKGSSPGQFTDNPWFITVSGQHDNMVVSDQSGKLYFFSCDGQHRRTIKADQSPYHIKKVGGVAIDELGQVIVTDREEGCLVVLGEDKVITTLWLPAGKRMCDPWGVTMTSDGSIIVCDFGKNQIHKFTVSRHKQTNASI